MQTPLPPAAIVPVRSSWLSKINWTQAAALALGGIVAMNPADVLQLLSVDVDPQARLAIAFAIQAGQSAATWILRTWFNGTVSPASLPRADQEG